jgi:hypothetical protein
MMFILLHLCRLQLVCLFVCSMCNVSPFQAIIYIALRSVPYHVQPFLDSPLSGSLDFVLTASVCVQLSLLKVCCFLPVSTSLYQFLSNLPVSTSLYQSLPVSTSLYQLLPTSSKPYQSQTECMCSECYTGHMEM